MDKERIEAIYTELGALHVHLQEDPRVMGPGYIARSIHLCREYEEKANELYTEVQRALSNLQQEKSLLELNRKVRLRSKMMSPDIQRLEISAGERLAHAEFQLEAEYTAEIRAGLERENQPIPALIKTLEATLVDISNSIKALETLIDCIEEKKGSINKIDSAVRLQEKAMESDIKLFGQAPRMPNGTTQTPVPAQRQAVGDPTWQTLTGGSPQELPTNTPNEG